MEDPKKVGLRHERREAETSQGQRAPPPPPKAPSRSSAGAGSSSDMPPASSMPRSTTTPTGMQQASNLHAPGLEESSAGGQSATRTLTLTQLQVKEEPSLDSDVANAEGLHSAALQVMQRTQAILQLVQSIPRTTDFATRSTP